MAYTESLSFDRRLWRDDIEGSRAHVRGLARSSIISDVERDQVLLALDVVANEIESGLFVFLPADEDIHTAVERRVTELAGAAGAKLHTGRSRNDQSATDVRLWTKRELAGIARRVVALQRVLLDRAREHPDVYLPGYTHLQRAQPVMLAHHLLAHGWALGREVDRVLDALERIDVSPLGAGALAGSSLPLDPDGTAADLGFARRFENSLDAVGSRDHVAEALFVLTLIGIDLSRLGEEIVLWTTDEFGFAKLDDAYATGSSMLPQKKNPDIAELARGKAGRLIGDLTGFLATMKGLPLSYNRDYQEDKEPLFDAVDQVRLALGAMSGMIATMTFVPDRMRAAADAETTAATDLAEWLVQRGMPFRDAHAVVGALVREALRGERSLRSLVDEHPDLGPDAAILVAPGVSVTRRITPGGAGPVPVADQLERFAAELDRLDEALGAPAT
ncbi:MAG: argininosuccinate lyase [Acidimicrobiales bacterium]|nr:argininosuccinate lyase [Acidimicrobiales bacterium]MCB9395411.1 argininosuccinate lyase [Acidimicrobiaceae bacterium]